MPRPCLKPVSPSEAPPPNAKAHSCTQTHTCPSAWATSCVFFFNQTALVSLAKPQARHSRLLVAARSGALGKEHPVLLVEVFQRGPEAPPSCSKWSGLRTESHKLDIKTGEAVTQRSRGQSSRRTRGDGCWRALLPLEATWTTLALKSGERLLGILLLH